MIDRNNLLIACLAIIFVLFGGCDKTDPDPIIKNKYVLNNEKSIMQITTLDSMATNLNVITTQAHSNNLVEERTPSSVITDSYNYYKELRVAVYTVIYRFSSLASSLDYCDTNLLGRIIYTTRSGIPQNSEASECIVSPEKYSDLLNADEFSEELKLIISNEFASYQKMEANYKKWVVN